MKFLHTGDLHLGKSVHDFSMLEEQKNILAQITGIAVKEKAEAVVVAGDIYDRSVPPAEAVLLLDDFLTGLLSADIRVILISGNHDSPERVGFASRILEKQGLFIAGVWDGSARKVTLEDCYGTVSFVCLPFLRPAAAGSRTYQEAAELMLQAAGEGAQPTERRVLLAHWFVTDHGREPELSDSETAVNVGGLDNVEASLLSGYDYVALGHIHKPQQIGSGPVYYAGAPLRYSFSETGHDKSVNLVEMGAKGNVRVTRKLLCPLHDMRRLRGTLEQIMTAAAENGEKDYDYVQVTLTDEDELIDPIGTLRRVYPNVMQVLLDKNERHMEEIYESRLLEEHKSRTELFADFYELVKGAPMDGERGRVAADTVREAEEEE